MMNEQNETPAPNGDERTATEPVPIPPLADSILAIGLIAVTAICCWMLYGRLIAGMLGTFKRFIFGA